MRNARISFIIWLLFPLLAAAQLPPLTRSVLTTNIPAFGSAGQALFRIAVPPYLNWSNVVASGGLSISDSNNIINLASNYTYAVSNYVYTASNSLAGQIVTASNAVLNASSNYTFAVSNLVVASTNGQFIEKTGGVGTNTTIRQVSQTGPALTIGTNAGAMFSIMGVTNGPSPYLVQIGSAMLSANTGGTNAFTLQTNAQANFASSITAGAGIDGTLYSLASIQAMRPRDGRSIILYSVQQTNFLYFSDRDVTNAMLAISNRATPKVSWINAAWHTNAGLQNNILFGVGNNDPQASLHVVGGATTNENALRVDTTNNIGLLSLTTNGVLTVKSNVVAQGGLISTNDFVYQRDQTGSALTIGTNAGATFSIMGVTNGPSPYVVQVGSASGPPANTGGTNTFVITTNSQVGINKSAPTAALDVTGQIKASTDLLAGNKVYVGGNSGNGYPIVFANSSSAVYPELLRPSVYPYSGLQLLSSDGAGYPSNFFYVAGQIVASNGIIAKVHSGYNTNTTPLQVDAGGGLNPVGCYGSLMMSSTNLITCPGTTDIYTNISGSLGFQSMVTNGFIGATNSGDTAALTNLYAGHYRVNACVSYVGANGQGYELAVFTNMVEVTTLEFKDTFDTPARLRNGSTCGIIYLPSNCRVTFKIQDYGSGTSVSIQRASFTIGTP